MEEKYPIADYMSMYLTGTSRGQVEREQQSPVTVRFNDNLQESYQQVMQQGLLDPSVTLDDYEKKYHQPAKLRYSKERQWEAEEAMFAEGRRPISNYMNIPDAKLRNVDSYSSPADPRYVQDQRGRKQRVRTDEEVFEQYGTFKSANGDYKPLEMYQGRNQLGERTRMDDNGTEYMLTSQYNPELGRVEWVETPVTESLGQSQIRSMHGPKPMRRGWVDAFWEQFTNAYVDMGEGTIGTLSEIAGGLANKFDEGSGEQLIASGRRAQNLSGIRKSKMSEAYENGSLFGPGASGEKWFGELGNLTGQVSATVALGYMGGGLSAAARGVGITNNLLLKGIQAAPSMGYMGLYAGAMADQEAKEMGLTLEDRMYLYPKMVAMTVLTEAFLGKMMGGRNWLETGMGYFENKAMDKSIREGLRNAITENMDGILARNLDNEAAGKIATSTFAKYGEKADVFKKNVGDWMERSRLGRAVTGGLEEGFEEAGQGIFEQGIKLWTDYSNYGTLDAKGRERKEGQGLFGLYDENGANLSELVDGMRESFVLGFVGGHVPGYFTAKPRETADLLRNFSVANHAVEMAYEGLGVSDAERFVDKVVEENYGIFNEQSVDGALAPLGQQENGKPIEKRSDAIRQQLKDQYRLAFAMMDKETRTGSDLQQRMGGDRKLLGEGIAMLLNAEQAAKELREMEANGTAPDDPAYARAREKHEKALDYGQKIMNGDVYGHYLAVNTLNKLDPNNKVESAASNAMLDSYLQSNGKQQSVGNLLNDIRNVTATHQQAQTRRQQVVDPLKKVQEAQQLDATVYDRFIGADNIVSSMAPTEEVSTMVQKIKTIKKDGLDLTPRAFNMLRRTVEDAQERVAEELMQSLSSDERKKANNDPNAYFKNFEGVTPDQKALFEMDIEKEFEPASDEENDALKAYQSSIINAEIERSDIDPSRPLSDFISRPNVMDDAEIERRANEAIDFYPAMQSGVLQGQMQSEDDTDHYYGKFLYNLMNQLEGEDPNLPSNILQVANELREELVQKKKAFMVLAGMNAMLEGSGLTEGQKDLMFRSLGVRLADGSYEMSVEKASDMYDMTENYLLWLDTLMPKLANLENHRAEMMARFSKDLFDIRSFVANQLAADYGISFSEIKTEAQLTSAEEKLSTAMRSNPMAIWKEGSGFRKFLIAQNDYPMSESLTNVWERRINSNQSLFTNGLQDFNLKSFHNPRQSATSNENESPSFRRHFVLNYAMTLMGMSPTSFLELQSKSATADLPGGMSPEQEMVLHNLVSWASMMLDGRERKLLTPFQNFHKLSDYHYEEIADGSWTKKSPSIYAFSFVPLYTQQQRAGLDAIPVDDRDQRISYAVAQIPLIPDAQFVAKGTTRAKYIEEVRAFMHMHMDPKTAPEATLYEENIQLPGTMMLQGNQGTGKTTRVLSMMLDVLARKNATGARSDYDVQHPYFVVHSKALASTFDEMAKELNERLAMDGIPPIMPTVLLKSEYFDRLSKDPNAYKDKLVVVDEATLLTWQQRLQLRDIQQMNEDRPKMMLLLMGDRYQTADGTIKGESYELSRSLDRMVMSTHNLTAIYRSGQTQVTGQISSNMHHLRFGYTADRPMPVFGGRYWQSADGTKRRGMRAFTEYFGTNPETSIVAHVKERIAQGNIENIAIIVSSVEEGKDALALLTGDRDGGFTNGVGARIFTFDEVEVAGRGTLNIQGLGVEQVYFMANPANIDKEGFASGIEGWNRMLNTSMGRMRDDGRPSEIDSRMGYWAGYVMNRVGDNASVENPWNIPSSDLDKKTLSRGEADWKKRIADRMGQAVLQTAAASPQAAPVTPVQPVVAATAQVQSTVQQAVESPINQAIEAQEAVVASSPSEATEENKLPLPLEAPAEVVADEGPIPIAQGEELVEKETAREKIEELLETKPLAVDVPVKKLYAYPVMSDGKAYTFIKGDSVKLPNGETGTIASFELLEDGAINVEVSDNNMESTVSWPMDKVVFNSGEPRSRTVATPESDTELLVHHSMTTLRMDTEFSYFDEAGQQLLDERGQSVMRSIKFNMYRSLIKRGGYPGGLPLEGKYKSKTGTVDFYVKLPEGKEKEDFEGLVKKAMDMAKQRLPQLPKKDDYDIRFYFTNFGNISLGNNGDLLSDDGSVKDWNAANNLKAAILARVPNNATVKALFKFGGNSMVRGSRRPKKAGPKRLLTGFLQDMAKLYDIDFDPANTKLRDNFMVVQDPAVKKGTETGTYIYYDVMDEKGDPKRFIKNPKVGRIELLSLPLQAETELVNEEERNFQSYVVADYINKLKSAIEQAEKGRTSDRHNEWRSMLSDFVRYNRKVMTDHLLGLGTRPSKDVLDQLGLALVPDRNGSPLSDKSYSVLLQGMGVRDEKEGTDKYYIQSTNLPAAKRFVQQLGQMAENGSLNAMLGKLRLPTQFRSGIQLKTLATDNPWQAHSHLMINSDYFPTLPMPVVKTNLLELVGGETVAQVVRESQLAQAPEQASVDAGETVEVPLPNGSTLAVHPDNTYELEGARYTEKEFAQKFQMRYDRANGMLVDAAPAGARRKRGQRGSDFIANRKPAFPSYEAYDMLASEAESLVSKMLGEVFAKSKLNMRENLRIDGVELYGALYRAGMHLDMTSRGKDVYVERNTPAEEAWHKVVEEVLDDATYKKLNKAAADRFDLWYFDGVANEELRERLAKEFNAYVQKKEYGNGSAFRLPKLLRDVFDMVLDAIKRAFNIDPIGQAFYKVYHGKYADAVSAQVRFELETGQLPNNRTFDALGQEVIAHSKGRANVQLAMSAFDGDIDVVLSAQHYIGRMLYDTGYFNPVMDPYNTAPGLKQTLESLRDDLPYFGALALAQAGMATSSYDTEEQNDVFTFVHAGNTYTAAPHELWGYRRQLADMLGSIGLTGSFNVGEEYRQFIHVSELSAQDLKAVSVDALNGKRAYFLYKLLSNDGLFESLAQRELDRMPINALLSEEMTESEALSLGGFVQDSIDNRGSDAIEVSTRMSDVLRNAIRHTPLLLLDGDGLIAEANGYFDYDIGVKVLEDLYIEASLPAVGESDDAFGSAPASRWKRVQGLMEAQLQYYRANNIGGDEMPRYASHLLSLYERFFNPGSLSYAGYSDLDGFDAWRSKLDAMYDAGRNVGEHDESDFDNGSGGNFDTALAHMKRFSSAITQALDSMFGDIRKARMAKTYAYKSRAKVLGTDGKWQMSDEMVLNTRTVQLRSDDQGDVRHALDHSVLSFVFDNVSTLSLSDKFLDVWVAGKSPNRWREGNPIHVVTSGANAGIYYVPDGMSTWDVTNDQHRLVSFVLDENGLVSSMSNNTNFAGNRQKLIGEVMEAFGIRDLYRAKRQFSYDNDGLGGNPWNDFLDIATRFSLASLELAGASAPNGPSDGYSWWMDAIDKSVGSMGYGRGPASLINATVLTTEDELMDGTSVANESSLPFYTFFFNEMNLIAENNAVANGLLGSSYLLGVNGERHQLRQRPSAITRGIDESGSKRWAEKARLSVMEAMENGIVNLERLDSSYRHLVDAKGNLLHPFLRANSNMSLKPTKMLNGFKTGINGKEVADMNIIDLQDFFIANFLEYNADQSHSGMRKGWVEVTISPDADRTQRTGIEMDIRTPFSDQSASEWTGHGVYDVRKVSDKEGNTHHEYRLAHRDILYHLYQEAKLRRNYQAQSATRLLNALLSAVERGELTDAKTVAIVREAADLKNPQDVVNKLYNVFKDEAEANRNIVLPQHLRFSGAYEGRDYIVENGYVVAVGNEARLSDQNGQEKVMTLSNIKAIERLVEALGGFDGTKWPQQVRYRKPGMEAATEHAPQQLVEEMVEQFLKPLFSDFSSSLYESQHRPLQSWNLSDATDRFNSDTLPMAYKAMSAVHYIANNYLNSYVGGTPYNFSGIQDFNKRFRSATSDYNPPGDVNEQLSNAIRMMRRVVVEDPVSVHVLGNYYGTPGEQSHVSQLKQTDGLSEDNPVARVLWNMAYGQELGPYPLKGHAKTIEFAADHLTKHSKGAISADSVKFSREHQLMVARMLDPMGRRFLPFQHPNRANLYELFMGAMLPDGMALTMDPLVDFMQVDLGRWDTAAQSAAMAYISDPAAHPMIGEVNRVTTQKTSSKRKVLQHAEFIMGGMLEGGAMLPNNMGESMSMAGYKPLEAWTENVEFQKGGVSNTISSSVDEGFENFSAQLFPILLAADADQQRAGDMKRLVEEISQRGFDNYLKKLGSGINEFKRTLYGAMPVNQKRAYAGRLMSAASRLGLDKTGDRGHLQALMYLTEIGMEVAAKGTKTDQLFQSAVRSAGIKFSVAGQRSVDNVVYGSDMVEHEGTMWTRRDLAAHFRLTGQGDENMVMSMPSVPLKPMHTSYENNRMHGLFQSLPGARFELAENFDQLDKNLKYGESAKTWLGTNKKPLVLMDGEKLGVVLPLQSGAVTVLWEDEQPVMEIMPEEMQRMEFVDRRFAVARMVHEKAPDDASLAELEAARMDLPNGLMHFRQAQHAKDGFAAANNLLRVNAGDVIVPSSYAAMLGATGIPLNVLFGNYELVDKEPMMAFQTELARLRSLMASARVRKEAALSRRELESVDREIANLESSLASLYTERQRQRTSMPQPYAYNGIKGMEHADLALKLRESLLSATWLDMDGNLQVDASNPNLFVVKKAQALSNRYSSDRLTDKTFLGEEKQKAGFAKMGNAQKLENINGLQSAAYERWLDDASAEIAHDLKKLEGELDVVMVRTPSTGAHSGGRYRVVEFSHGEANTVRQSPLNFTTSGKDLDGDAVTIYHRPYAHPSHDRPNDAESYQMMTAYMDFMTDFYTDPRHAATVFDPINTKYATKLSDSAKDRQRQVKGGIGTDLKTIYQSYSGKHTVGNSALRLKQMSFLVSSLRKSAANVYWYNRNVDGTRLDEMDVSSQQGIYRQMNLVSTTTNLGADNSKDQVLGTLGITRDNVDVMMQLLATPEKLVNWVTTMQQRNGDPAIPLTKPMSEQVWDAMFYLFGNDTVQRWVKNQQFFGSIRMAPSENSSYLGLTKTLSGILSDRESMLSEIDELAAQEEVEKNRLSQMMDGGRAPKKNSLKRKDYDEQSNKLERIRDKRKSLRNLVAPETAQLLFNLAKSAVQADQMVLFGRLASMNQGLPNTPADASALKRDIELLMGMPFASVMTAVNHIESNGSMRDLGFEGNALTTSPTATKLYSKEGFELRKNYGFGPDGIQRWAVGDKGKEYLTDTYNNGLEGAEREEVNYADSFYKMDFLAVAMDNPELRGYLRLFEDKLRLLENDRLTTLPSVAQWQRQLLDRVGRDRASKSLQKWLDKRTEEFFLAMFVSDISRNDVDLRNAFDTGMPIAVDRNDAGRVSRDHYAVMPDLSTTFGTDTWMHHFPHWFESRKQELMASDPQRYGNNTFLQNLTLSSNGDMSYLVSAKAEKGQENQRRADFKVLPPTERKLLAIYAMTKDGLNYRAGSLIEQLDEWMYIEYSKWAKENIYETWGVPGREAQTERLEANLEEYGDWVLSLANKYLLKRKEDRGARDVLAEMPLAMDSEGQVPYGMSVPANKRENAYYRSSHNLLFNSWRPGNANVVQLRSKVLEKDATASNHQVHFSLPLSNRQAHLKQVLAHRHGRNNPVFAANFSELSLKLPNTDMAKRYKDGDRLYFPDGTIAEVTGNVEMNGYPGKTYRLLLPQSIERMEQGTSNGPFRSEPVRDVRRAMGSFGTTLDRAVAVDQSKALISAMRRAFPRIDVRYIRDHNARAMGRRQEAALSFIQDGVVYINLDKVEPSTAVHELVGHIASAAMYMYNRPAWEKLAKGLAGGEVEALVRKLEPGLSGVELQDETVATFIDMVGGTVVKKENLERNAWLQALDWLGTLWNKVKSVFLKDPTWLKGQWFDGMTLEQMAETLIENALKGKLTAPFTSAEYAAMWGGLKRKANGTRFNIKPDTNFQQLVSLLENNPFGVDQDARTKNKQASYIFDAVQRQAAKDGVKRYHSALLNETIEFTEQQFRSDAALRAAAMAVAVREQAQRKNMSERLLDFLQRTSYQKGENVLAAAKASIRKGYADRNQDDFLLDEVRLLQSLMGYDPREDAVFSANDPNIASYGLALKSEWLSPGAIVIVHNARSVDMATEQDQRLDAISGIAYSIFNVMDTGIKAMHSREDAFVIGQSELFDNDGSGSIVRLNNGVSDMNKLRQALALAASSSLGSWYGRPMVRSLGTISMYADSNAVDQKHGFDYSLANLDTVLPQARAILKSSRIYPSLDSELSNLAEQDGAWKPERYRQPLLQQLKVVAASKRNTGANDYREKLWDDIYNITLEHLDPAKSSQSLRLNRAARMLLEDMRRKDFKGNEKRMLVHPAYKLLLQAAEQSKSSNDLGHLVFKPRNWFMLNFDTPNNFSEPIMQHWFDQMQKALWQSNHELQSVVKATNAAVDKRAKQMGIGNAQMLLKEQSRRMFGHLYKKKQFEDASQPGKMVGINTYELHHDPMDEDTMREMAAGNLTVDDLEMSNSLLDTLETYLVGAIINESLLDGRRRTEEEARDYLFKTMNYRRGMLPVLSKSLGEALARKLGGGKNEADAAIDISNALINSNLTEYSLFDTIDKGEDLLDNHLGHVMLMQLRKPEMRDYRLGLRKVETGDGTIKTFLDGDAGLARNASLTENLQSIVNYTASLTTRVEAFQTHFVDTHKNVLQLAASWGMFAQKAKDSEDLKNMLDTIYARVVLGRTQELKPVGFNMPGGKRVELPVEGLINLMGRVFSNAVLGLRPQQFLKEALVLTEESYAFGYANKLADNGIYTTKELNEAIRLYQSNPAFVHKLNEAYLVANKGERDLISGRWNVSTLKNILESDTLHIATSFTNYQVRLILMVAQMAKDGSLAAHKLDKDGNLVYDPTEDRRFSEGGKLTENGKRMLEVIRQNNRDTKITVNGIDQRKTDDFLLGYDNVNRKRLNGIADQFVTGGVSPDVLSAGMSNAFFRAFMLFRSFSTPKLQRWLSSGARSTMGQYEVSEEGDIIHSAPEFKSIIGSWASMVHNLKRNRMNTSKAWAEMSEEDRYNLRLSMIDAMFVLLSLGSTFLAGYLIAHLFGLVGLADPDEEDPMKALEIQDGDPAIAVLLKGTALFVIKTSEKASKEIMSDVDPTNIPRAMMEDPFPAFGYVENALDAVQTALSFTDKEYAAKVAEKLSYQVPGLGLIRDTDFFWLAVKRAITGTEENGN